MTLGLFLCPSKVWACNKNPANKLSYLFEICYEFKFMEGQVIKRVVPSVLIVPCFDPLKDIRGCLCSIVVRLLIDPFDFE